MMGSDIQKNARLDRQRILDVKDDDGVTALMMLGSLKRDPVSGGVMDPKFTTHLSLNIVGLHAILVDVCDNM